MINAVSRFDDGEARGPCDPCRCVRSTLRATQQGDPMSTNFTRLTARAAIRAACIGAAILLAGCDTLQELADAVNEMPIDDALTLVNAGVDLTNQRQSTLQAYQLPASSGYSQRGAFEDCAALYAGVAPQMEATCRQRASNMNSLR
jgi:hypothetical protein